MDKIPLPLLEALLAFDGTKNIEAAAKRLGLTQPALSKQLKRLEASLPEPVFFLRGRSKELTPFGRDLCAHLKTKMGNIQDVVADVVARNASPAHAKIRIAARGGILQRILALPFPGFLKFEESSHDEIIEKVKSLRAEIGITHQAPASYELVAKPLFTETFRLVVPKTFLPRRPSLTSLSFLTKHPCLGYRERDELLAAFLRRHDLPLLHPHRVAEDYGTLARMAEAGLGWTLLPSYFETPGCWTVEFERAILPKREFFLIFRPESKHAPWFKDLLAQIQRCF